MILSWVHGFLGIPLDWKRMIAKGKLERFENDFRDLWFDIGSLASTGLRADAGWLDLLSQRLEAGLSGRQKPTLLIGYSMGARLAMLAVRQKSLWPYLKGLVLVSAHPGLITNQEKTMRLESDRRWAHRWRNEPWESVLEGWNKQSVLRRHGDAQLELTRIEKDFDRELLGLAAEALSLSRQPSALLEPDLDFRNWPFPVHLITGAHDEKFTILARDWVAKYQPSGALYHHVVSGAGHRVPWDNPKEFTNLVDAIIASLQNVNALPSTLESITTPKA